LVPGAVTSNRISPPLTVSVLNVSLPTEPSALEVPGRIAPPVLRMTLPSLPVVVPSPVPLRMAPALTLTVPAEAREPLTKSFPPLSVVGPV
jgi:hypothetical protein